MATQGDHVSIGIMLLIGLFMFHFLLALFAPIARQSLSTTDVTKITVPEVNGTISSATRAAGLTFNIFRDVLFPQFFGFPYVLTVIVTLIEIVLFICMVFAFIL